MNVTEQRSRRGPRRQSLIPVAVASLLIITLLDSIASVLRHLFPAFPLFAQSFLILRRHFLPAIPISLDSVLISRA